MMAFYHSRLFDLRATGERIQRMASEEQAGEVRYFGYAHILMPQIHPAIKFHLMLGPNDVESF